MNSISTNPFEDDEDEIEEQMEVTKNGTSQASKVMKPTRKKKRRAPPPPPGQQQMVRRKFMSFKGDVKYFEDFTRIL